MLDSVKAYIASGGNIKIGITKKAKGSKTFKGRYNMTVAGLGRKSTQLRNSGYYCNGSGA